MQRRKVVMVDEKSPVVPKRRQTTGNGVYPYRILDRLVTDPLHRCVCFWFTDRAGILRDCAVAPVLALADLFEHPVTVVVAFAL